MSVSMGVLAQVTMDNIANKKGDTHDYFIEKGMKRYLIKSGMRVVVNEGFGATIDTIYWDHWGFREGIYKYHKKKALKGKKKLKPQTVEILDGANSYSLNLEQKTYLRISNPLMKSLGNMDGDDFIENEEKMVEQWLGGEKLGNETIDGKECTKYKVLGGISWVYKGLTLKTEANILGLKSASMVSLLNENMEVPESKLSLPEGFKNMFEGMVEDDD